jgi:hypothetical protein
MAAAPQRMVVSLDRKSLQLLERIAKALEKQQNTTIITNPELSAEDEEEQNPS